MSPISFRALIRVIGLAMAFASSVACAATDASFSAPSGNDIPITGYPAKGDALVLWLPSESGLVDQEKTVAQRRAAAGVEVWQADLFTAYFLPTLGSSMEKMPAGDVEAVIKKCIDDGVDAVWPGCDLWPDLKRENVEAYVRAVREYGKMASPAVGRL